MQATQQPVVAFRVAGGGCREENIPAEAELLRKDSRKTAKGKSLLLKKTTKERNGNWEKHVFPVVFTSSVLRTNTGNRTEKR